MEYKPKQINFNTVLILLCNILAGLSLWLIKDKFEKIEATIMPRHEIEIQINTLRENQNHSEIRITELQTKVIQIELDMAKNKFNK